MKALICGMCMDIRALEPKGEWTPCRCGNAEARWLDPARGTVRVRAKDRELVRILGMNNAFLLSAIRGLSRQDITAAGGTDSAWRRLHGEAVRAPGYLFDEARRACWACVVRIGETNDIAWEEKPAEG